MADDDQFSDYIELYLGTDALDACPDAITDDAWPPDMNNDTQANVLDVLLLAPHWGARLGQTNYDRRFDLNADGFINVLDVLLFSPVWGRSAPSARCSNLGHPACGQ